MNPHSKTCAVGSLQAELKERKNIPLGNCLKYLCQHLRRAPKSVLTGCIGECQLNEIWNYVLTSATVKIQTTVSIQKSRGLVREPCWTMRIYLFNHDCRIDWISSHNCSNGWRRLAKHDERKVNNSVVIYRPPLREKVYHIWKCTSPVLSWVITVATEASIRELIYLRRLLLRWRLKLLEF